MRLRVKVVPRASRTEVAAVGPEEVRIRVAAPPERGRANEALIRFLAAALGAPASRIRIAKGASSPRKTLEIEGIEFDAARTALARLARPAVQ